MANKNPPKIARTTPTPLDVAALEQMVEPLTVQIVRVKNGQFSPIALPTPSDDMPPGTGWTRGEVLAIDQGWLVNSWSGGGLYQIMVTDSTAPEPQKLTWSVFWDPQQFPEKTPPTMTAGLRPGLTVVPSPPIEEPAPVVMAPAAIAAQPQQGPLPMSMPLFPQGLPAGGILTQPATPAAPVRYAMPSYDASGYSYAAAQAAQVQAQEERRRIEERLAATEAQLRQAQADAAQRSHQAEMERLRAEHQQNMQRLEQRMAEMSVPKTDPSVAQLQAELAQQRAQAEADRRERDAERREAALREQMIQQNQAIQAQLAQMQQNFQAMLAQTANKGPDPMIQLMIEQNRNSMEAMKEIARQSNDGLRQMQGFMMNPRDVMAMTQAANAGLDGVTSKITSAFSQALDMQQRVVENAMQLQGGGNETIGLIRDGVGGIQSLAERYFTVKSKETQVTQQAQATAAQAQAQAQAITAQAQAAIAQAHARTQTQPQMPAQPAPPRQIPAAQPQPSSGLNGASNGNGSAQQSREAFEQWQRQRDAEANASATKPDRETVNPQAQPAPNNVVPLKQVPQRSDEEWFGPLLGEVQKTRAAVDEFMTALKSGTANQLKEPATAQAVAQGIFRALALMEQHGIQVPAVIELLFQDKLVEFMAVFLPGAPIEYRNHVVEELVKLSQAANGDGDDDEDDEDGEEHDDVRDGSRG